MNELTVGDIRPLLDLIASNPLLDQSQPIASQLRSIIEGFGAPITPELDATLTLIEQNPILVEAGVAEFRAAIEALPDSTLLSDVPGFGGTGGGATGGGGSGGGLGNPDISTDANGNDIKTFSLPFSGTTIDVNGDQVTVSVPGGGTETLTGLDRLEFTDGTLFLDVKDGAGLVAKSYEALLGRGTPDAAGFDFWLDGFEGGTIDTFALTNAFAATDAFAEIYGAVLADTGALLGKVYQNLFGREVDAPGLQFWSDYIDASGGGAASIGDALGYMVQSAEFQDTIDTSYADGVFV